MADCIFTSRGQTRAQLMLSVLQRGGVNAALRRLPLKLTSEGCAYGVAVDEADCDHALAALRTEGSVPRRIYCEHCYEWVEVSR